MHMHMTDMKSRKKDEKMKRQKHKTAKRQTTPRKLSIAHYDGLLCLVDTIFHLNGDMIILWCSRLWQWRWRFNENDKIKHEFLTEPSLPSSIWCGWRWKEFYGSYWGWHWCLVNDFLGCTHTCMYAAGTMYTHAAVLVLVACMYSICYTCLCEHACNSCMCVHACVCSCACAACVISWCSPLLLVYTCFCVHTQLCLCCLCGIV